MKFVRKYWIICFLVMGVFRFLLSYKLPSFYVNNLRYDDRLMMNLFSNLISGNYLGTYDSVTLVKGVVFPFTLALSHLLKISYSVLFTLLYILSCVYFISSLSKIVKSKKVLFLIYVLILFNPISYSSDLFSRLYRNSLSVTELLLFLGVVIRIISNDKQSILNYVFLGFIVSIMSLTREDNIWTSFVIVLLIFYKLYKDKRIKTLVIGFIPFVVLTINLNIVSYINYRYYGIYTYNELQKSSFKDTYKKILSIKDSEKIDKVSIPKSTFYSLIDNTETFNLTKEEIDKKYERLSDSNGEIHNGNIIWYLRYWINEKNEFKDGHEEDLYYKNLGAEIDNLFDNGTFKSEFVFPSILLNRPTFEGLKELPKSFIDIIAYTSSYKNVKVFEGYNFDAFDEEYYAYKIVYHNYRKTENIVKQNDFRYEVIRLLYKYLTLVFTPISLIVFFKNIKRKDKLNLFLSITTIIYFIIISGVAYTNATAFPTIRYLYLGNVYILQSIFILLNIYRLYDKTVNKKV